jgi:hypothetical protein
MTVSKDWRYLQIVNLACTIFGLVGLTILPESPSFLLTKKRYGEAK